ncbi:MAG: Holliday junction branch migration protein RuvA [Clostridia bacterium]|nr:Holliday junction branch migration protein RuvA [Clostridia bacterium]
MFYCLTGKIIRTDANAVVLDCGGVGFFLNTTLTTSSKVGSKGNTATLYTHLSVKEDALDLYGFIDEAELDFFRLLISVTGVGPKAALSILSLLTPDKLAMCIASGDSKTITKAPGIGPKIAQRIVLELKDKMKSAMPVFASDSFVQEVAAVSSSSNTSQAVEALTALGYAQNEAAAAVSKLDASLSTEELIKKALKALAMNF